MSDTREANNDEVIFQDNCFINMTKLRERYELAKSDSPSILASPAQVDSYNKLGYNYSPEGGSFPNPTPDFSKASKFQVHPVVDLHPWISNLKVMAEWLGNGESLPHGVLKTSPNLHYETDCEECGKMWGLRFKYFLLKENDGNVMLGL